MKLELIGSDRSPRLKQIPQLICLMTVILMSANSMYNLQNEKSTQLKKNMD